MIRFPGQKGRRLLWTLGVAAALFAVAGGGAAPASHALEVVTTTTIVQDFVKQVAGDRAVVRSLLGPDVDPHAHQAVPADMVAVSRADVIFVHGANLDAWATPMVARNKNVTVITVTDGLLTHVVDGGALHPAADQGGHGHEGPDPHYWFDPNLASYYVERIRDSLAAADPQGADVYHANAARYLAALKDLDAWITARVNEIPVDRRKLVTNHDSFRHFAERYGFEVVGTVIPSFHSDAEPSARQIAQLARTVRESGVFVIFTENSASPKLAEAVAREAGGGVRVVPLYTGSLSPADGPAATYLDFMRYNVDAIVEALRQ